MGVSATRQRVVAATNSIDEARAILGKMAPITIEQLDQRTTFRWRGTVVDLGPLAAQRFGESMLLKLLDGHPHNYSDRLARLDRAADPRSVRLAAAYLESNLGRAVRLDELARVAGVSARAIQIGFRKHRACTPVQFLREARLTLARTRLLQAQAPHTTVAEVARDCGFVHLGRFSAHYRARFGELPTTTLGRG